MSAVYDPQAFHSDGTPKRKYEIEVVDQKRFVFGAAVGLIAVNLVVLIKNVLFGAPAANNWADGARAGEQAPSHGFAPFDALPDEQGSLIKGSQEQDESEKPIGDGKFGILKSASYVREGGSGMASASFGGQTPLQLVANDNELLYGSRPGTVVTAFNRADGDTISHGGGGGDVSLPPDEDDDDDDDETPPPRPNRAPLVSGPVVLAGVMANTTVVIAFADLLRNASDPDGDKLYAVNLKASSGKLQVLSDGRGWIFTPNANDTSSVKFTYSVTDLRSVTAQTAELDLLIPEDDVIVGTEGDDRIVGTMNSDVIDALGGDDVVIGRAGDDVIYGGAGNDRIFGEDGNDLIYAGAGDDFVSGGRGNDVVFAGRGRDIVFGDDGDDVLHGEEDDDVLSGGTGRDIIFGGDGKDRLMGDADNDLLDGGEGDDELDGGDGDDTLIGARGADRIAGGAGNERVRATEGDGDDDIDGGAGTDTYDTTATSAAMQINLFAGTASSSETGNDTIASVENVETGAGDDTVVGSDDSNTIATNAGDDTISAGKGDDTVLAGAGDDTIAGAPNDGDDSYDGGAGTDVLDLTALIEDVAVDLAVGVVTGASIGHDLIMAIENVNSGAGNDTITGDGGDNVIAGGAGCDTVDAGGGNDTILASIGDGDDIYAGGDGSDVYDLSHTFADAVVDLLAGIAESGETGTDTLYGIENVVGGAGNNTLIASNEQNDFSGGEGEDVFVFRSTAAIGNGYGSRDKILDFSVGDRIDIRDISDEIYEDMQDAFVDSVMRKFVMIQGDFFAPGQVRLQYDVLDDKVVTVLQGNIDKDMDVDFELELVGRHELQYEDFRN